MTVRWSLLYPGIDQKGFKHNIDAAYNVVDIEANDTQLFGKLLPAEDGPSCNDIQLTYDFGFVGSSCIYAGGIKSCVCLSKQASAYRSDTQQS